MSYKTDIEIAREHKMLPIETIAETAGIPEKYLERYGRYKAKIDPTLCVGCGVCEQLCKLGALKEV